VVRRALPHPHVKSDTVGRAGRRPCTPRALLADPRPVRRFAFAASVTSHLKLGTGIALVAQRDPIWTAKEVASLDHLSGGRVIFGVGYGWNREEMAQHGTPYAQRRLLMRDKIMMMKALWTQDEASYNGDLLTLEPSWAWPKPAQKPHPPIVMGAAPGSRTLADMAGVLRWVDPTRQPT